MDLPRTGDPSLRVEELRLKMIRRFVPPHQGLGLIPINLDPWILPEPMAQGGPPSHPQELSREPIQDSIPFSDDPCFHQAQKRVMMK